MRKMLLIVLILLALPAHASVPPVVATEGMLSGAGGVPLANGAYTLTFRLYAAPSGGLPVWQETANISVASGRFAWELGTQTPLSASIAAQGQWIGVQVGTEPELARAPWRSSPFALRAQVAEGLECSGCVKSPMLDPGLLAGYALLSDLTAFVKTADLDALLTLYAKAADLAAYAKLTDLSVYAKISDLADYAKLADLTAYEKSSDLAITLATYAKAADLVGLAKLSDLALHAKLTDLTGLAKTSDLAPYALKTDLGGYVTASGLVAALAGYLKAADAFSGKYADLTGKPTLAQVGAACSVGQVVTGIAGDGSLQCAVPAGGSATTLSAVSNGLLENVFDLTYPSTTTPLSIPDNNPGGVLNEIVVPDVGIVKAITVSVNVTNQDISGLVLTLFDPNNNSYVLYNKGSTGTALVATYPTPTAMVSGDLAGTWVGQNAKGTWRLIAADWK